MAAIDDGFADASASQISLMNKFTVVYEDLAIKIRLILKSTSPLFGK